MLGFRGRHGRLGGGTAEDGQPRRAADTVAFPGATPPSTPASIVSSAPAADRPAGAGP
jgi:hypothetical protein